MSSKPKIAAVQFEPLHGQNDVNRAKTCALVREAAAAGAKLIVLPECCIGGMVFASRDELRSVSEPIPGPTTDAWSKVSRETGSWVVGGLSEVAEGKIYNSAVLIGPEGQLHRHRKMHIRGGMEKEVFDLGRQLTCVDTPLGRIGLAICYDMWFPEVCRSYALQGADIVAAPANWLGSVRTTHPYDAHGLPQGYHLLMVNAMCNELVVVGADRIGKEGGIQFLGTSCIFGPSGEELCKPASRDSEQIIYCEWPEIESVRKAAGFTRHLEQGQGAAYTHL
jgi:5-aminopentanamidase